MLAWIAGALWMQTAAPTPTLAALETKTRTLEKIVQTEHIREGLLIPTVIHVTKGNPAFTANSLEDVCTRTGEYVQAESLRYAATHDREARANAARSAMALLRLEQVTGTPGCFARAFKRAKAPSIDEQSYFFPGEWHASTALPGYRWLGDPSVDQLNDWVIGLTTFYDLAATPEEQKRVQQTMARVMGRILTERMRIVDTDGKMTLWGNLSPDLPHEHLNALLALDDLLCAHHVTKDFRFLTAYQTLIRKDHFAEEAAQAKTLYPEWAMNASDDNLGMEALDRLLAYERDPHVRPLYLAALRRYWMALQYDHIPLYDEIVERYLSNGLDSRSVNYLTDYTFTREPRTEMRRTARGDTVIEGTWQEAPYEYLRAYWYARYYRLLPKAARLHDLSLPSRPDAPKYTRPPIPPSSVPEDLDAMVQVPAGPFIMGATEGDADERPVRRVTLPTFWIDKYLVTNMQYERFDKNWAYPNGQDLAPALVTWSQAAAYAKWAGKRLPTEAEWEKAARGTDGRMFPWGDFYDVSEVAWDDGDPQGRVTPCVSSYGCVDMVGNVWQWTADWYDAYPGATFHSPAMGHKFRVLRGGASFADRSHTRCAHRYYAAPDAITGYSIGFRCVRDYPAIKTLPQSRAAK